MTDRLGRKKLFMVTLGLYLAATAATAFSWNLASFAVFRFLTGAGIGGEYAAINSAIQELVPARFRGRTDLAINGSFWVGAAMGALGAVLFLQPGALPADFGWRAAFGIGAVLGLFILLLRRWVPESPRWLMLHDRHDEATRILAEIEARVVTPHGNVPAEKIATIRLVVSARNSMLRLILAIVRDYPKRAVLGLTLMSAQAFFYNAIFFSYALVLTRFYQVPAASIGWYILPFALGNFAGPLLLGPLFDIVGRKPMIASTYAISGLLLAGGRVSVPRRAGRCGRVDRLLDGDLLLRLGGRERGLSDGQRKLSARSPRAGDRGLLCGRHRDRRGAGAVDFRRC